jgi:aryl carrier-like protein
LKHAIAESIGVPEETLEMDRSYRENGGNSFSMMSTFVRLKEQGSGISMEEFLQAETLTALHDSTSSSTFRPLSSHRKFRIKPLSEVSTEKTQNLLVECFIKKGEMKEGQKTSTEDLASILKMTWPVLLKYSFVMVDEAGEISGVTTLADEVDLAKLSYEGWHPYLREVSEYLESLTLSVQHQLPHNPERGSYWLWCLC